MRNPELLSIISQLLLAAACVQPVSATNTIDLQVRYPTTLTGGDEKPERARPWQFTADDVFFVSKFNLKVGQELEVEIGPADLGIGHCPDGAVWAILIPRTSGRVRPGNEEPEPITHLWLRFHPARLGGLFPADTVTSGGRTNLVDQMRAIANYKMNASWQAGGNAMIPGPKDMTVDADVKGGRRFYVVDTDAGTARYESFFASRPMRAPPVFTSALAEQAFDELWENYDRDYAMFVLRPEVDWKHARELYRPRALKTTSAYELAGVFAEMLKPLRDLHIWVTVAGAYVPVFNRPRESNSNPSAHERLLGKLQRRGTVRWAVTEDKVGFIAIYDWQGEQLPSWCDEVLENMRNTRGLIVDVRLNGGGSEDLAQKVAGRFVDQEFVYGSSQYRNGPEHTNLTDRLERTVIPRGAWRYSRPVVLLIGQKCMSSNESFVGMMTGATNVITMGDHTCGSSGNPKMLELPLDIKVSLPRWIDNLPDGTPLDERGFRPQVQFQAGPGAFDGDRDDLLDAALQRLRQAPLPEQPIPGAVAGTEEDEQAAEMDRAESRLPDHSSDAKEEGRDPTQPKVVAVNPPEGAAGVPAMSELRVRFDRPMNPFSFKLDWEAGGAVWCDVPSYNPSTYEFLLPVRLAPGRLHQLVVNRPLVPGKIKDARKRYPGDGFRSSSNGLAGVFAWQFRTAPAVVNTNGAMPKVLSISPVAGSKVGLLSFVEIQFDQPMAPPDEACPFIPHRDFSEGAGMINAVEYNPAQRTFRVPLLFPPGKSTSFTLAGFRSADGIPVRPIKLDYETGTEEFSKADAARFEAAARDPQLLELLSTLKQKRGQLKSVSERVQTVSMRGHAGLFTGMRSESAEFRWQAPGQYYGDVSEPMLSCSVFRIGSDGENWWSHSQTDRGTHLVVCPVMEMQRRFICIGDPFDLLTLEPETAATQQHLRYVGLKKQGPDRCALVAAWGVEPFGNSKPFGHLTRWAIDSERGLPAELTEYHDGSLIRLRFTYEKIDQPISRDAFAIPNLGDVVPTRPEPLDAKYNQRFINLKDGSDGHMSVRWGKMGPAGRSSGGLN